MGNKMFADTKSVYKHFYFHGHQDIGVFYYTAYKFPL